MPKRTHLHQSASWSLSAAGPPAQEISARRHQPRAKSSRHASLGYRTRQARDECSFARVALAPAVLGALSGMPRTGSSVAGGDLRSGSPTTGFSVLGGGGGGRPFSGGIFSR